MRSREFITVGCLTTKTHPCTIFVDENRCEQCTSGFARDFDIDGDRSWTVRFENRRHTFIGTARDHPPAIADAARGELFCHLSFIEVEPTTIIQQFIQTGLVDIQIGQCLVGARPASRHELLL